MKPLCTARMILIVTLIWLGIPAIAATADEVFVQSVRAAILTAPKLGAKVLVDVHQGDRLVSELIKNGWHKVSYGDQQGWIFGFLVGKTAPRGVVSLLDNADSQQFSESARRRASSFTTAAAARGLRGDRKRANQTYQLDYAGVEWMEKNSVNSRDALVFMTRREGLR